MTREQNTNAKENKMTTQIGNVKISHITKSNSILSLTLNHNTLGITVQYRNDVEVVYPTSDYGWWETLARYFE